MPWAAGNRGDCILLKKRGCRFLWPTPRTGCVGAAALTITVASLLGSDITSKTSETNGPGVLLKGERGEEGPVEEMV